MADIPVTRLNMPSHVHPAYLLQLLAISALQESLAVVQQTLGSFTGSSFADLGLWTTWLLVHAQIGGIMTRVQDMRVNLEQFRTAWAWWSKFRPVDAASSACQATRATRREMIAKVLVMVERRRRNLQLARSPSPIIENERLRAIADSFDPCLAKPKLKPFLLRLDPPPPSKPNRRVSLPAGFGSTVAAQNAALVFGPALPCTPAQMPKEFVPGCPRPPRLRPLLLSSDGNVRRRSLPALSGATVPSSPLPGGDERGPAEVNTTGRASIHSVLAAVQSIPKDKEADTAIKNRRAVPSISRIPIAASSSLEVPSATPKAVVAIRGGWGVGAERLPMEELRKATEARATRAKDANKENAQGTISKRAPWKRRAVDLSGMRGPLWPVTNTHCESNENGAREYGATAAQATGDMAGYPWSEHLVM